MCGIVGAASRQDIVSVLVQGLQRLEYRGYDSCGIAVHNDSLKGHGHGLRRARDDGAELEAHTGERDHAAVAEREVEVVEDAVIGQAVDGVTNVFFQARIVRRGLRAEGGGRQDCRCEEG